MDRLYTEAREEKSGQAGKTATSPAGEMAVCIFFRFTFYCFGTIVTLRTGSSPTDWVVTFGWSRNSKWMMRIYAARGDRMGVVDQYQACREALEDELGVPVSSETEALYQRLTS